MPQDHDLGPVANFLYEAGTLKHHKRTGWWIAGIKDPETVAEHSWRAAVIATVLATLEGADPARAALIAVWHDTGETRTGDLSHLGQRYLGRADAEKIAADQTTGMPAALGELIRDAIGAYEARDTPEGRCAADADKLECLIQAIEYRDQGHQNAQRWIESSYKRLKTPGGVRLADELLRTATLDWIHDAMGEPRS